MKSITNKPGKPPANLTTDKHGQLLQTPKAVAEAWKEFLSNKFKATEEEHKRPPMEKLPRTFDPVGRKEFEGAVKKLNMGKATESSL